MNKQQNRAIQTRKNLIQAAITILRDHGSVGLTLENVAREAEVSKGGLLHHFSSKNALIEGVLRQLFVDFEERVQFYLDREPMGAGRCLRAYIRATYDEDPLPLELGKVIISSAANNPDVLLLIQQDFAYWQERLLHDGISYARAMIIRQAADAFWDERFLGVATDNPAMRTSVMNELLNLAQAADS